MSLLELKNEYLLRQSYQLSDKQKKYILLLLEQSTLQSESASLFTISKLLKTEIREWSDLTKYQVSLLISYLIPQHIKINTQQESIIEKIYNIQEINQLLKTSYELMNEISLFHYRNLLNLHNSKNRIKTHDVPINSCFEYEYGYQVKDYKLHYVRFYSMMMIDYDHKDLNMITEKLLEFPEFLYSIYETFNGYHVFIISHEFHYRDPNSWNLMKQLGCDDWYIFFVKNHGYKIRLNPKPNRNESYVAKFIKNIGSVDPHPQCQQLIKKHDELLKLHIKPALII